MEGFKPILESDAASATERRAFLEMLSDIELGKNDISEDTQLHLEIEKMVETLPTEMEKEVIRKRFFRKETLEQIGKDLGVSRERVRGIESIALRHLRHPSRIKYVEGVELKSLSKDTYHSRLYNIICQYRHKTENNKRLKESLDKISYFTWTKRDEMRRLNSLTFNQICEEISNILKKDKYTKQDIATMDRLAEKIRLELENANKS